MRVLFVTHTVTMAGANSSMLRLMQELRDNYQVEPVALMPHVHPNYAKRNLLKACHEQHIECYSYRFYWFKQQRNWKTILKCFSNLLWYPRILWKMRGKKYDIIHSNGSVISLGALISRAKRIPHVWHLREYGLLGLGLKPLLGNWYEKWVYQYADTFIAISKSLGKYYSGVIPEEKIRLIYNGVLPPHPQFLSCHNNMTVCFCMLGLLSAQKNQMDALKAADILVNRWGMTDFHIYFIGLEEHEYSREMQNFIIEKRLSDYVTIMGESNDVSRVLCSMDIGLMLSSYEAFGRVTVEYMMHNLAVIASDSGANCEIVEDGRSGLVYPLGDVEQLAWLMRFLATDKAKMVEMAVTGKERAMNMFTSFKNTEQIYQTYLSLVSPS